MSSLDDRDPKINLASESRVSAADADHLVTLLRTRFLNRTDTLAHKAEWGSDCPLEMGAELIPALRSHVLGEAAPKVTARWRATAKKKQGIAHGPFRLGTYSPAPDGTTLFACLDFDGTGEHKSALADPLAAALATKAIFERAGLTCYLERSKSGTGWHLWIFFAEPVPAALVRRVLLALIPKSFPLASGKGTATPEKNRGVEVFPKQDNLEHTQAGLGNMVCLPWWNGAVWPCNQFHEAAADGAVAPYIPDDFTLVAPAALDALDPGIPQRVPSPAAARPARRLTEGSRPSAWDRAVAYVERCPPAISGQGGHNKTMDVVRAVVYGFDLGEEQGFSLLWIHYNPVCNPPWSEAELRHKCFDADTKPFKKSRGWLLDQEAPHKSNGKSASYEAHGQGNGKAHSAAPPQRPSESSPTAPAQDQEEQPHLTDRGNAIRLVRQHGADLRHCHPWRKWLAWEECRWSNDSVGEAPRRAKRVIADLFGQTMNRMLTIHKRLQEID